MFHHISEPEFWHAALLASEQLARPAQFQVRLGNSEPAVRVPQDFQPLPRLVFLRVQNQNSETFRRTALYGAGVFVAGALVDGIAGVGGVSSF